MTAIQTANTPASLAGQHSEPLDETRSSSPSPASVGAGKPESIRNYSVMGQGIAAMEEVMVLFTELANAKFDQMSKKTEISRDAQDKANAVEALLAKLVKDGDTIELSDDIIAYMRDNNILVNGQTIDEFVNADPEIDRLRAYMEELLGKGSTAGMGNSNWDDLTRYMEENGILVEGRNIFHWIWDLPEVGHELGKEISVESMKKVLDAFNAGVGGSGKLDKADLMAVKSALESTSGRASDFVQQSQLKLQQFMQNFNTAVAMINSVQSMNAESTKSVGQAIR